jgi:hypothetical protein
VYDLQQSPKPAQKVQVGNDPSVTHMYRTPSPGSQGPVNVPRMELDEDPYDIGYFKRDTRRRYLSKELGDPELEKLKIELLADQLPPEVTQEALKTIEQGPQSSPGNKGIFATGPTNFDPTGLRATMSVTWGAYQKSLDTHMPDHLPRPVWHDKQEEVVEWHTSRNLPVPLGAYYHPLTTPVERRVAFW